jgi:myo-inositol-1(or 4)-monophosphatase
LLVVEAGGLVGDLRGEDAWYDSGHIIAATPKVFAQMVQILGPLTPAAGRSAA